MSRFKKLSHVLWHCQYHIVWIPKYRYKVLKYKRVKCLINLLNWLNVKDVKKYAKSGDILPIKAIRTANLPKGFHLIIPSSILNSVHLSPYLIPFTFMTEQNSTLHGGVRTSAGRKKGSSVYGETTKAIRVPESMITEIQIMLNQRKQLFSSFNTNSNALFFPTDSPKQHSLPLFTGKVAAGFPSPADDYIEKTLDLNDLLIKKPAATFFVRASGESMLGAGIHPNDILVVDRSITPVVGKIVICALNDELTVKRLKSMEDEVVLGAENPDYSDIIIQEGTELVIWGVVTNVIHSV